MEKSGQPTDIAVITDLPALLDRCKAISLQFDFSWKHFPSMESFMEQADDFRVILAGFDPAITKMQPAEIAQGVRFCSKDSFLICVFDKSVGKDAAVFAKKSGGNLILLENEVHETSKLEFILMQVLQSSYIPLKAIDLIADQEVTFDIYHLLPQRKKFLKFIFAGDLISEAKLKKIADAGEFYILRDQAGLFKSYIDAHPDASSAGMARRCRSRFLALYSSFSSLIFLLTDQSEKASFGEGERLLKKCIELSDDLIASLGEFGNAWEIINNSSVGQFGSVERAPAVAAYAALFAFQMNIEEISKLMLISLLADLGLLFLSPDTTAKIREDRLSDLSGESLTRYHEFPKKSLELCLDRKLPIDAALRSTLLGVHERADRKGFPDQIAPEKIPLASQIIQFANEFDRQTLLKMGKAKADPKETLQKIVRAELEGSTRYTSVMLEKLRLLAS